MNIFMLSYETNPHKHFVEQARFHCDKHVVKMIAESTQIIVTALSTPAMLTRYPSLLTPNGMALPCKSLGKAHAQHPCVLWASQDMEHIYYVVRLAIALCVEKSRRYPLNPDHQYYPWLFAVAHELAMRGFMPTDAIPTHFPVAVKGHAVTSSSAPQHEVVNIYRSYYVRDKASFATWKAPAATPVWFLMAIEEQAAKAAAEKFTFTQGGAA